MAAAVDYGTGPVERKSSSTLLDLQLRRRERRSRNFLLHLSPKEDGLAVEEVVQQPPPPPPPKMVAKTAEELVIELSNWFQQLSHFETTINANDTSGKFVMPSLICKDAPSIEPYPDIDDHEYKYTGGRDIDKEFHGLGRVDFDNGCCMTGEWKNGERTGKFRMDAADGEITFLEGFYVEDKLQGRIKVQLANGNWAIGYAKESVLHGFCRYFDPDKRLELVGMTRNGKLFGTCWKTLSGGGFLVGRVDSEGQFTGSNIAYIYPDLRTAMVGYFEKGDMLNAQAVTIQGFETEYNCIKVPVFSKPEGDFYRKEVSTTEWLTESPLLEDPYEQRTVFVKHSNTPDAQEGLFANRDLKSNTIAAFYNGLRKKKPADSATTWQLQENAYKIFDPTDKTGVIDILPKFQSMENYRASLAHKTNHSFLPNCEFSEAFHPRWGLVPCLVTRQDVARGEELLVWYGYDLDYCPDWYKEAWENSCQPAATADESLKSG